MYVQIWGTGFAGCGGGGGGGLPAVLDLEEAPGRGIAEAAYQNN